MIFDLTLVEGFEILLQYQLESKLGGYLLKQAKVNEKLWTVDNTFQIEMILGAKQRYRTPRVE